MAIKDFQYILEKEPENTEANKELMQARNKLNEKLEKESKDKKPAQPPQEKPKESQQEPVIEQPKPEQNKFVRVSIEEDDEDEEEDEQQ